MQTWATSSSSPGATDIASPVSTDIACFASNPVLDQINEKLKQSNFREMLSIECDFRAGMAILQGRVRSFYAKQTAQELVRSIDGVREIRNHIDVV